MIGGFQMAIIVDYDNIVGNALILFDKEILSKKEICRFYEIVVGLLPKGYEIDHDDNFFEKFCAKHCYGVKKVNDTIIINKDYFDKSTMMRYFRMGQPKKLVEVYQKAAKKVLEEEQYNPNTDRESLKFCLSLTHKQFMDVLDKKYPNMPNRIADVCYLAALGLNVRQIAKLLGVSDISVRQYMNRFCKEIELQESGKKAFYAYIYSSLMD